MYLTQNALELTTLYILPLYLNKTEITGMHSNTKQLIKMQIKIEQFSVQIICILFEICVENNITCCHVIGIV